MISLVKGIDRQVLLALIVFEALACYNFYTREVAWYPPGNWDQSSYLTLLRGRPKWYWDFHHKAGRLFGYKRPYSALIYPAVLAALDILFKPKGNTDADRPTHEWAA